MSKIEKNKKMPVGKNTEFEITGMCFNKELNKEKKDLSVSDSNILPIELRGETVSIKAIDGGKDQKLEQEEK